MDKYPLIGVSIVAVILLVLGSLTNVVGYQTVQSSNQKIINEEVDQKELLFQTIVDIANNKEIQQIILKSQISKKGFFNPDVKVPIFNTPLITKSQLKQMYVIGLMLSKTISKSRIHSLFEQHQMIPQGLQKEITAIVEKDATINEKLRQLSDLKCDCEDNSGITTWQFPIICAILGGIGVFSVFLILTIDLGYLLYVTVNLLGELFNCPWTP